MFYTCKLQRSTWLSLDSMAVSKNSFLFHDNYIFSNAMRLYEDILKLRFGRSYLSYNIILQFSA